VLALCPGAEYGPAKRWPARHFAAVAVVHLRRGGSVWLLGAARDAPITAEVERIVRETKRDAPVADLAGRTSLTDAVDLLACADAVVTNDSGLMHIACALRRRVVAVYGSTSPEFTPPLANDATVVRDPPPCAPCFERLCPLGHTRCLEALAPERVVRVLAQQA
jgi:heptosyltransferase-2